MQTQQTISQAIGNLIALRKQEEQFDAHLKEIRAQVRDTEAEIADYMNGHGLSHVTVEGREVKFSFSNKYSIKGGKGDSEQRQTILSHLEELGFGDKIQTFRNIHGRTLNSIFEKLPPKVIDGWIEADLLSVYPKPEIKIR
jgi:hypothetical protein